MTATKINNPKEDRLEDFRFWIEGFQSAIKNKGEFSIELIPNAAHILNDVYWDLTETYIRPLIDGGTDEAAKNSEENRKFISRFKVISVIELTIISVLPFESEDEQVERQINAKFAFFVAIAILHATCSDGVKTSVYEEVWNFIDDNDDVNYNDTLSFKEEHERWLELINTDKDLPFFSNAQTWRMFYCALKAHWKLSKLN